MRAFTDVRIAALSSVSSPCAGLGTCTIEFLHLPIDSSGGRVLSSMRSAIWRRPVKKKNSKALKRRSKLVHCFTLPLHELVNTLVTRVLTQQQVREKKVKEIFENNLVFHSKTYQVSQLVPPDVVTSPSCCLRISNTHQEPVRSSSASIKKKS